MGGRINRCSEKIHETNDSSLASLLFIACRASSWRHSHPAGRGELFGPIHQRAGRRNQFHRYTRRNVQSLVFSSTTDIAMLRNGKIYSQQYNGSDALSFQDQEGIQYQFPLKDVETLVLTQTSAPPGGWERRARSFRGARKSLFVPTKTSIRTTPRQETLFGNREQGRSRCFGRYRYSSRHAREARAPERYEGRSNTPSGPWIFFR